MVRKVARGAPPRTRDPLHPFATPAPAAPGTSGRAAVPAWNPSLLRLRTRKIALTYVIAGLVGIGGAYVMPFISAVLESPSTVSALDELAVPSFAFPTFAKTHA